MTEPRANKAKARWQLGMILFFETVISIAAVWLGFTTQNWPPVIAVLACGAVVTALMVFAVLKAETDDAAR